VEGGVTTWTEDQPVTNPVEPTSEETMAAALRPFGWECGPEFFRRYYTDPWVFNLANAVERLTERVHYLEAERVRYLDQPTDDRHIIDFRNDGWTIQHPVRERLDGSLFDCDMSNWDGGDIGYRGRYVLLFDEDGQLVIGDEVPS
jgi:hypothetical protein